MKKTVAAKKKASAKNREETKEKKEKKDKRENKERKNERTETKTEKKTDNPRNIERGTVRLTTSPNDLKEFTHVLQFVGDLKDCYKSSKNILYYHTLLSKVDRENSESVNRQLHIFNTFCKNNIDVILTRGELKSDIVFNKNGYLDLRNILKNETEKQIKDAIWEHITTIAYYTMRKVEKAKGGKGDKEENKEETKGEASISSQLLSQLKNKNAHKSSNEDDFISGLVDKLSGNIGGKEVTDPSALLTDLMMGGSLTEIFSDAQEKVEKGELNINRLLGSVQGLIKNLSVDDGENAEDNAKTASALNKQIEELMAQDLTGDIAESKKE